MKVQVDLRDLTLAAVLDKFAEGHNLGEADKEAIRGVFYSGASAVLTAFDGLTSNALKTDAEVQELLDAGYSQTHPEVVALEAQLDQESELIRATMSKLMTEVCNHFGVANNSAVCHDEVIQEVPELKPSPLKDGGTADVTVVKQESKDTFDLSKWNPTDDGNVQ